MINDGTIKVGVTGQTGFVGTHLYNELGIRPARYERIPFEDHYFNDKALLSDFVRKCDVIVHLAAVNRHADENMLYLTNVKLVSMLVDTLIEENVKPHVVFSSSTQENSNNAYGKSKSEGRRLFAKWAGEHRASFTGMIIPNVFGPFGQPNYNSFVATFCHELTHGGEPIVINDGEINLVYVSSLCRHILSDIEEVASSEEPTVREKSVPPDFTNKVSGVLKILNTFKEEYFDRGIIPDITHADEINLFNTFRSFIDADSFFPRALKLNTDERGTFIETVRTKTGGQVSFSTTKPGVTRGNHYHTKKIERFTVIRGKAKIQFRRTGTERIHEFLLDGANPSYVDMPVWFTHNITNVGDEELYTQFWINEWHDPSDPDTFFEITNREK